MSLLPHQFWQSVHPAGTYSSDPGAGFIDSYPAELPDGRQVLLPVRVLPGDGNEAVCSLIVNQASFEVEDALAEAMAELSRPCAPQAIIGVPTLGLPLANGVARRLGHPRMVALGTSRKFWYSDDLSEPLSSITSPAHAKTIFLDPRMLPVLDGKRIVLIDDVVSSGASACAVLRLLAKAGIRPAAMIVAMLQGERWRTAIKTTSPDLPVLGAMASPRLSRRDDGRWQPNP